MTDLISIYCCIIGVAPDAASGFCIAASDNYEPKHIRKFDLCRFPETASSFKSQARFSPLDTPLSSGTMPIGIFPVIGNVTRINIANRKDNHNVRSAEIVVHHSAFADLCAQAKISLYQRWHLMKGLL